MTLSARDLRVRATNKYVHKHRRLDTKKAAEYAIGRTDRSPCEASVSWSVFIPIDRVSAPNALSSRYHRRMDEAKDQASVRSRPRLKLAPRLDGFCRFTGPFSEVLLPSGMRRALELDARHENAEGLVHAGVLSTMADFTLERAVSDEFGCELRAASVQINLQMLATTRAGRWLYGEALVLRRTRELVFVSGELFSEERSLVTMSGIWKLISPA